MVTNRDDSSGSGVQERVLSVLLNEMDGIGSQVQSASRSEVRYQQQMSLLGEEYLSI